MSNTIQVSIAVELNTIREELVARLSAIHYDAFEENETTLEAFTTEENFSKEELEDILNNYHLSYKTTLVEDQNWNALWESNFEPVIVHDFCAIRAHFHPSIEGVEYEIIITPKMSFGTGHHATTFLMIQEMQKLDFKNKSVADFGTGTGILAILADKLGSEKVLAIDYDDWSINNATENIEKNNCHRVEIEKANSFQTSQKFDIILANINKHVILENAGGLLFGLHKSGKLLLSGLLLEDEKEIIATFTGRGFSHISTVTSNNWICLLFTL